MIRPAEHLVHGLDGPVAVVDGRICQLLNRMLGLDKLRGEIRGQDAQLDQTLLAIHLAALQYSESSATGTKPAPVAEPVSPSPQQPNSTYSTTTAAAAISVTDRAIRRAIVEKRLAAMKDDGGRYRIKHEDLAVYAAQRVGDR